VIWELKESIFLKKIVEYPSFTISEDNFIEKELSSGKMAI